MITSNLVFQRIILPRLSMDYAEPVLPTANAYSQIESEASRSSSRISTSRDSIGDIVNTEADVINGSLNLSNKQLTGISLDFKAKYNDVKTLNISHNSFHSFKSTLFPNCTKLDISHNRLNRITSLAPLAVRLQDLNVSNNDIIKIDGIQQFLRLECLNSANNGLRDIPLLETYSLRILDLSGNFLSDIPDLSKLYNLEVLNLSQNKISSLKNIHHLPSKNLTVLSISSNQIEDISEILFLTPLYQLDQLEISPNPALPDPQSTDFNYRHLVLCALPNLTFIDGESVENADALCGEHLLMQGKLTGSKREFTPGSGEESHNYVCNYLKRKNADLVEEQGKTKDNTPLKANMLRVLNMKEQYDLQNPRLTLSPRHNVLSPVLSRATEDDYSNHSPCAEWNKRMGKENADPETTDASPVSTQRSAISRNIRMIETGIGNKTSIRQPSSRASHPASPVISRQQDLMMDVITTIDAEPPIEIPSSEATTARSPPQPKPRSRVDRSPVKTFSPDLESSDQDDRHQFVTPKMPAKMVSTPLSRRRQAGFASSRKLGVADISAMSSGVSCENDLYDRIEQLESKLVDMGNFCNAVSKTNEELSLLLIEQKNKFMDQINKMQAEINSLILPPVPVAITVCRRKDNMVDIKWDLMHVQGYNVFVNGANVGRVSAPARVARISELEKGKENVVQLEAVSHFDKVGMRSAPLKIPVPVDDQ